MQTPLYKRLKENGTSFYAFPGSAEDISAAYQSENYRMYFSKYVLLNFPKKQSSTSGTQSQPEYFDFDNFETSKPAVSISFSDEIVESLRNYVANHEVTLRESRLNNTEYYYDTRALETTSEKIFWKWCKKLGVVDFERAIPQDEYFNNLPEFERLNLSDDSYFPEVLWKERDPISINVISYETAFFNGDNYLKVSLLGNSDLRVGDIVYLSGFENDTLGLNGIKVRVLQVSITSNVQSLILDFLTSTSLISVTSGKLELVYHKLVQYIGEVNGVSNVQEANRAYTEVYAHIPDHTGQTPDILFRTIADRNYKPGLEFPIIPSQYQPEIIGAENFTSPIVSNPTEYPGSYYGQFDTTDFTYECESGDTLRRSGRYYGVLGDVNDPIFDGSTIDGIVVDFDTQHYVKMNINDREVSTFDEFNALEVDNLPPRDFEFNAILWYYNVEDLDGNVRTNIYGISFLDNPDNNPVIEDRGVRFPVYKKLVTNGSQDGTSYAFGLNLNFNIIHDNPQEAYNPEAINSLFSMNLFNESMRKLSSINDSFINVLAEQSELKEELSNIKQLIYTQTDLNVINSRINNLEQLLTLYSTQQLVSSDTIEVELLDTNPSTLRLNNIDPNYNRIESYLTSDMYDINGAIPVNVGVLNSKNFLIHVTNNDIVDTLLPNNDKLTLFISDDLFYRQSVDILITPSELSSENKKMDIFITTINPLSTTPSNFDEFGEPIIDVTPPVETLLIGNIDLPVYFNKNTSQPNSASTWKDFKFDIDLEEPIEVLTGSLLRISLDAPGYMIQNSVKVGDSIVLNNLFVGTSSTFDFSGQYIVDSVVGNELKLDIGVNQDFVNWVSNNTPLILNSPTNTLLSNYPYLSLNKGYMIKITRISDEDNITLSEKYFVDIRDLQY
jgi:hypothetical protein